VLRGLSSTRLGRICGRRRAAGAGTACARQGLVLLDHIDLSSRIRADKKAPLTVKSYPYWPEAVLGTFRVICVRKDIGCGRIVVRCCHGFAVLEGNYGQLVPNRVRTVPGPCKTLPNGHGLTRGLTSCRGRSPTLRWRCY